MRGSRETEWEVCLSNKLKRGGEVNLLGAEEVTDPFRLVVASKFTGHEDVRITSYDEAIFGQNGQ